MLNQIQTEWVNLAEVTPSQIEAVKAGEISLRVKTPKNQFGIPVERHTVLVYETDEKGWPRRVAKICLCQYTGGKWCSLYQDQLLQAFEPEKYAKKMAKKQTKKAEAKAKAIAQANSLQVGDIMTSCWGYDQINSEAYQIVAKTAQTVTVREIACKAVDSYIYAGREKMPVKDAFLVRSWHIKDNEKGKTCRVDSAGYVRINEVIYASKWSGGTMYESEPR